MVRSKIIPAKTKLNPQIAYVLGNGESRLKINLHELKKHGQIWGCNALYRDFPDADVIVSVDRGMTSELKEHNDDLAFEHLHPDERRKNFISSVQGPICPDLGWSAGPSAMRLLCQRYPHLEKVYLIGFDLRSQTLTVNNVYKGTDNYVPSTAPVCPSGQWVQQMTKVYEEFPETKFIRVGYVHDRYPPKWKICPNVSFSGFEILPEGCVMKKKKSDIVFISFFTEAYEEVAERLKKSVEKQGLIYDIEFMTTKKGWLNNVRFKPNFILQKMKQYEKADAVVWVDADAVVNHYPALLFELDYDMAVHYCEGRELLSGTMYWSTNERAIKAMEEWIKECGKREGTWEQRVLQAMLENKKLKYLKIGRLPTDYCKIFDKWQKQDKGRKVLPIIEHFQHSRNIRRNKTLRRLVDGS